MDQPNYLVLAQYRTGSAYDDEVGHRYHFPKKYFNQLATPDAEFIYFEPKARGKGEYFGYGQIGAITPDEETADQFFVEILNYRPFPLPVPGDTTAGASREAGPYYNKQNAVRRTSADIFASICADGGIDVADLGTEVEISESDERIVDPFDPSKIKVDRDPMSVFQVLRKLELGEVLLHPDFQRNVVWDPVRRSRLVESVLLRIPLPAFYFDGVDANRWSVVDGLQRLSTLRDFVTEKGFSLSGMEYLKGIEGRRFDQLPRGMQRDIEETQITVFIIRPETPPEVKFTIFYRINTGGLVLTAQEIRHALFQGPATELLKELAESPAFATATDHGVSDTRMDARECVLRFIAFRMTPYQRYEKTDLNRFLSRAMKQLNAAPASVLDELRVAFADAMGRAHSLFGRRAFRKFTAYSTRRGPINKALFESWANVVLDYERDELLARHDKLRDIVANMFLSDADYVKALSAGTGSVSAVQTRFACAHDAARRSLE